MWNHQFVFRHKNDTPEQIHRIVQKILLAFERSEYCSALFIDVQKVFHRALHISWLYKIPFPITFIFLLLLPFTKYSDILDITFDVPQGCVLGPLQGRMLFFIKIRAPS